MRSFLADYDLVIPTNLSETLQLLASGEGWRPMAGGTDIMVLLNAGKLPFRKLVSVRELPELRNIIVTDDYIEIGAAVTYTQIRLSSILQSEFSLLCDAAGWTGGIANQNRGTIGGNIANASPAADSSPMLLAYDAELNTVSSRGVRSIPYRDFHVAYKEVQLGSDEIVESIRLPRSSNLKRHYSRKVGARRAQAISKVCLAVCGDYSNRTWSDVRIALGSVAPIPMRCYQTEAVLRGRELSLGVMAEAVETLRSEIRPITDIRSTDIYRRQVSANLLRHFLCSLE